MKYTDQSIRPIKEIARVHGKRVILTNATKAKVIQAKDWMKAEMTKGIPLKEAIAKLMSLRNDIVFLDNKHQ
jgi:hypothetical protein